jgi:GNAT superfamily N-acetyltransferase
MSMSMSLERVTSTLPIGFAELEADAVTDGHRHMTRLAAEVSQTPEMFYAVFLSRIDGELAGIGAITCEPGPTLQPTWRMRRLYVHRKFRRRQVASAIVTALLAEAAEHVGTVTVHAGSDQAACFWEAIGFRPVANQSWSHERATGLHCN